MRDIQPNFLVGGIEACSYDPAGCAVVHACKEPCHRRAVGYEGNLTQSHPEYLVARRGNHLFLNLVDMERRQRHQFMEPMIQAALTFIGENLETRGVVVHCNEGFSRAPTLAMLFLAKRDGTLPDTSFIEAAEAFRELYPPYAPARGIALYLSEHWTDIA
jgi:predicted protein tyrosine phosphatase